MFVACRQACQSCVAAVVVVGYMQMKSPRPRIAEGSDEKRHDHAGGFCDEVRLIEGLIVNPSQQQMFANVRVYAV